LKRLSNKELRALDDNRFLKPVLQDSVENQATSAKRFANKKLRFSKNLYFLKK